MLYPPLEYTKYRKFLVIFRNGKKRAIDEAVIKITQDVRKLFAIAQVEMLFVEFFFPEKEHRILSTKKLVK